MISANELQQILAQAKSGSKAAEERLFEYLRVRFSAIAKRRIKGDYSEDIAHDACLVVLEKYKNLPDGVAFEPWAYKSLRNKIGTHMRDSKLSNSVVSFVEEIENLETDRATDQSVELKRILINCLRKLARVNQKYIRALSLTNQGFSTGEVCDRLNMKPNHLYVMLHRCRKLLYDCIYKGDEKP